ncbi:MAG: Crp/Fnr family transcriptional regulator [Mariprofundaceae bacterium]
MQPSSRAWLNGFPELRSVDDAIWNETLGKVAIVQVKKGDVLFHNGDGCNAYVLAISGSVRVQKMDTQGREIVLYRVEEGQSCMLTTICLMGLQQYPAEGVAESDSQLAILPLDAFEHALAASKGFRRFVMRSIGSRICDLMQLVEDVAFGRMDARLARLLLQRSQSGNELDCTHQNLAVELGTAREVVSRLLKDFERKGWVRLSRGKIALLQAQALKDACEQEQEQ